MFDELDNKSFEFWNQKIEESEKKIGYLEVHDEQLTILREYFNPDSKIVDLGCGTNLYKKYYSNLVGVDVMNHPSVDIQSSILNFQTEDLFDGALCLGSIQYYSEDYIYETIRHVKSLVKKSGFIVLRCLYTKNSITFNDIITWDDSMVEFCCKAFDLKIVKTPYVYPLKEKVLTSSAGRLKDFKNITLVWQT